MLAKRIIPCLDVKDGKVVKSVQFRNHHVVGDILELADHYCQNGADELVFYDVTASFADQSSNSHQFPRRQWVEQIARLLDIPFCVAGGIRSLQEAESILNAGADKIAINAPALENPELISQMAAVFGTQCVVIGVDSLKVDNEYRVLQYIGDTGQNSRTERLTTDWLREIQDRGAGEIMLNCMSQDGMRNGYDVAQLRMMRDVAAVPLIAAGGAGSMQDFADVFQMANVDAALAATVFHSGAIAIADLKDFLRNNNIRIR